ncbi:MULTISPECIES: transposase [Rhodomicrobium]|uniref:transposase n=1 Tax=Rhodomicrobium TaxID=1068 RepID=UPI000BA6A026|nr:MULTISPECIES: transposase [Rhodomicrobium]
MQAGWYKEVRVKRLDSHAIKALLASRALLVKIKRDMENQIRGLLKNFGLVIGRAKQNTFTLRADDLLEGCPELAAAVEPLLQAREAVGRQIVELDGKVRRLAKASAPARRLMTAPGVCPITALCFLATIDDPARFGRSRNVGAYLGLTTRRYASGEIDWTGRISKCGDAMLRSYLYEAASVLLTRVAKWSAQGLGHAACQAQQSAQGQGRRGPQAVRHPASDVGRRHRLQLVIAGGSAKGGLSQDEFPPIAGHDVPAGTMAVARSPQALRCS